MSGILPPTGTSFTPAGRGVIKGGLKRIEVLLGIGRNSDIVDGRMAPRLWQRWEMEGDEGALETLLAYNREDCTNLEILESILDGMERGD